MNNDFKQKLRSLGLAKKEIDIYLAVLAHGKVSATDLSKITGIQRTTVYSAISQLVKLGFVIEELGGAKRHFLPGSPESLANIYKEDWESLEQKKTTVNEVIRKAKELQNDAVYSPPKIRFIQEEQVKSFLYEQASVWIESIMKTDKTWWGFQDHVFAELFEEWIDWFWEQTPSDLDLKLLSNKSEIEERMKDKPLPRRQIRYWDGNHFTATVWVVGEYIVTLSLQDHPYHIVQIHDPLLAENLRGLFLNIWQQE